MSIHKLHLISEVMVLLHIAPSLCSVVLEDERGFCAWTMNVKALDETLNDAAKETSKHFLTLSRKFISIL